jgi:ferric enterobactin receptor
VIRFRAARLPFPRAGLLSLLFATATLASFGQQRATDITGVVQDAVTGEALPFANIAVQDLKLGTSTSAHGYFVLADVPGDSCSLLVTFIGYRAKRVSVDMALPLPRLEILLEPTSIQLAGVTILGTPTLVDVPRAASQIGLSPRTIAALPGIGQPDIFRTLQLLPGINAGSSGSSELYVRGGTPDQNLVLFDGMTIYHVDHFFGFFSAFNTDAVKDIHVSTGGFPAEFGGRVSSVINLTGKSGNRNATQLAAGLNLLSANAALEGPIPWLGNATYLIAARRSYTDFIRSGLYDDIYRFATGDREGGSAGSAVREGGPGSGRNAMTGSVVPLFYFYDFNAKLTMEPSVRDVVSLSLYAGKDDLDKSQNFSSGTFVIPGADGQASVSVQDFSRWGNFGASARWMRQWDERFSTTLLLASSDFYSNFDRSTNANLLFAPADSAGLRRGLAVASKEDNAVRDRTVRVDAQWQCAQAHTASFGLWSSSFSADYRASLNDSTTLFHRGSRTWLHAAYAQDRWVWRDLELTAGLRASYSDATKSLYVEPRLAAVYTVADGVSLTGAWGMYHQFVNRIVNENVLEGSREFWLTADADLPPTFAEHRIIGVKLESADLVLRVEAYDKNLENLIQYSRRFREGADFANFFFFGNGTARGLEFFLQKKAGDLTGWIGYTLASVEYTFPKLNGGLAFPADQDHRHDVKTAAKYTLGEWTFSATWVFATGNAFTAPESQYFIRLLNGQSLGYIHISGKNANRLPDFHQLDLSVSKHFAWSSATADVGLSIFNAYNRKNVSYREYTLTTTPITITDVTLLGFTPTVFVQMYF